MGLSYWTILGPASYPPPSTYFPPLLQSSMYFPFSGSTLHTTLLPPLKSFISSWLIKLSDVWKVKPRHKYESPPYVPISPLPPSLFISYHNYQTSVGVLLTIIPSSPYSNVTLVILTGFSITVCRYAPGYTRFRDGYSTPGLRGLRVSKTR